VSLDDLNRNQLAQLFDDAGFYQLRGIESLRHGITVASVMTRSIDLQGIVQIKYHQPELSRDIIKFMLNRQVRSIEVRLTSSHSNASATYCDRSERFATVGNEFEPFSFLY